MQKIMLIFSKVQPIFKAHRKVKSYIFSLVLFSFLQQCMRACRHTRNTSTSSLFLYRFKHPFCCKTKLGGHFKGGVIPLSFFKVNVSGNIYKPERLVWPVKILFETFNTRCFNWEVGLLDALFLITGEDIQLTYGLPPRLWLTYIACSIQTFRQQSAAVNGERVKLFPLIFFLREFFSCSLLSERLEKTGYLAILVYFSITQTTLGYLVMPTQSNCIYVYIYEQKLKENVFDVFFDAVTLHHNISMCGGYLWIFSKEDQGYDFLITFIIIFFSFSCFCSKQAAK